MARKFETTALDSQTCKVSLQVSYSKFPNHTDYMLSRQGPGNAISLLIYANNEEDALYNVAIEQGSSTPRP